MHLRSLTSVLTLGDLLDETGLLDPQAELEVTDSFFSEKVADVAFVIPVHNQADIINKNLTSISASATLPFEIVLIVDACSDSSIVEILKWINDESRNDLMVRAVLVESKKNLFETIADSVGVEISRAPLIIEIQADMRLTHVGFDSVMAGILNQHPEIFLLSGRGIHRFNQLAYHRIRSRIDRAFDCWRTRTVARRGHFSESFLDWRLRGNAGRLGRLIEFPIQRKESTCRVFVGQTVMRGPLAFKRELYEKTGGFDTKNFFLGNDDHDLAMRALDFHDLKSGYVSISFDSPLENGSTRVKRTAESEDEFVRLVAGYGARAVTDSHLFTHLSRKRPKTLWGFVYKPEKPTRPSPDNV